MSPPAYPSTLALSKRDLYRYFSNTVGYVFVTLFILLSAAAAFWRPRFFLNNLANLDQLTQAFPYLLLFFVPALTMAAWSEERKLGTDELLLTLPATDFDFVVGKYLASVGTYTVALALSLSHVLILAWLGNPDLGLMAATYVGYWLTGAALIALGTLASLLTANAATAFILGSLFCAVPVALSTVVSALSVSAARRLAPFSVSYYLNEFGGGLISLTGLLYFGGLIAFCLYLNTVVLSRRHWPRRQPGLPIGLHHTLRVAGVAVTFLAMIVLVDRLHIRVDVTADRVHSLTPDTRRLIEEMPADRSVLIRAFVSPEVPEAYVQPRESLLAVLRAVDAIGGGKIRVVIEDTEPYSPQAQLARERHQINPRVVVDPVNGTPEYVYLSVALAAGPEEQVIPFLERGLSAEYEITRSIRVVTHGSRKRIGVIDSDVKILGGVDYRTKQPRLPWSIVDELRKQYDVVEVLPRRAPEEKLDGLVVVIPSILSDSEMDLVLETIRKGTPTLILVDPLPLVNMEWAPAAPMAAQIDPYRSGDPAVQRNFGDIRKMLSAVGVNWVPARIVWDRSNPHPDMSHLPPEAVFVGRGNGNPNAVNPRHPATAGLAETLMMYPGYLLEADAQTFSFEPLLQTGRLSGAVGFFQATRPTPGGPVIAPPVAPHQPDGREYVLAAHVRSKTNDRPDAAPSNVIVIADLDFISDTFFDIRATAPVNASFDNINLFLNAIDVLVGDVSMVTLRQRRVRYRTLERIEAQTRQFVEQRAREEQQAEQEARTVLEQARNRVSERVDELRAREDLDEQARQILVRNLELAEGRRLQFFEANINAQKEAKIQVSREMMERQLRQIRSVIRAMAVLLPPVPVVLIGVAIFARRRQREREVARGVRRFREQP